MYFKKMHKIVQKPIKQAYNLVMAAKRQTGNVIVIVCLFARCPRQRLLCPLLHILSYGQHLSKATPQESSIQFSKEISRPLGRQVLLRGVLYLDDPKIGDHLVFLSSVLVSASSSVGWAAAAAESLPSRASWAAGSSSPPKPNSLTRFLSTGYFHLW